MQIASFVSGAPFVYFSVVIFSLPIVLVNVPTSDPLVEEETLILLASMYSPSGSILSSTSLFILPAVKFRFTFGIFYLINLSLPLKFIRSLPG